MKPNTASLIVNNNTTIINNILEYIYKVFNITSIELKVNIREYIKRILYQVRDNNIRVKRLRLKRKEIREDIEDLKVSMVGSQSFDGVQCGKNTGLKTNTVYLKNIKIVELGEELQRLAAETMLLEKSLNDNNKLIEDFINLIPNVTIRNVMTMTYIDCLTSGEIAAALFYSIESVDTSRWRGLKQLEELLSVKFV